MLVNLGKLPGLNFSGFQPLMSNWTGMRRDVTRIWATSSVSVNGRSITAAIRCSTKGLSSSYDLGRSLWHCCQSMGACQHAGLPVISGALKRQNWLAILVLGW